ncbi:hypothetical protein UlMin_026810 [Ulmus minor]
MRTASGSGEEQPKLKLYSYFRSSCSFRVRIALNLKVLPHHNYHAPQALLPCRTSLPPCALGAKPLPLYYNIISYVSLYVCGSNGKGLLVFATQYESHAPILPNRLAANIVSATIQPLQNIGILKSIAEKFSQDEQLVWVNFHIGNGFAALEKLLKEYAGKYATGDEADIFLAPQLHVGFNRLHEEYSQIPAFQDAMPEKQPDTPSQSIA